MTSSAGLAQPAKEKNLENINQLIFNHFDSGDALKNRFAKGCEVAYSNAMAVKFVDKMYSKRQKICFFYTKNVFTCGHSSTV